MRWFLRGLLAGIAMFDPMRPILAFVEWTGKSQRNSEIGHLAQGVAVVLLGGTFHREGEAFRLNAVWFLSREVANGQDRGGWTRDETRDLEAGVLGGVIGFGVVMLLRWMF